MTRLLTLVANSRGTSIGPSLGKVGKSAKGKSAALTVSTEFATSVTVGSTPITKVLCPPNEVADAGLQDEPAPNGIAPTERGSLMLALP